MRSASFRAFAEALAGRRLASGWGLQVLRYGPGDYAGPHNDHHPENKDARGGYIDLHVSLCSPGVAHQWLVYSRAGHFSEIVSVARPATVTAYRLPFWHYTTPLVAKHGSGCGALGAAGDVPLPLRQPRRGRRLAGMQQYLHPPRTPAFPNESTSYRAGPQRLAGRRRWSCAGRSSASPPSAAPCRWAARCRRTIVFEGGRQRQASA